MAPPCSSPSTLARAFSTLRPLSPAATPTSLQLLSLAHWACWVPVWSASLASYGASLKRRIVRRSPERAPRKRGLSCFTPAGSFPPWPQQFPTSLGSEGRIPIRTGWQPLFHYPGNLGGGITVDPS